jgi:hypothetical protein
MDIEQVVIVALFFFLPWLSYDYFKYKSKLHDKKKINLQKEVSKLRERIIILEKIITDRSYTLNEELTKIS